MGETKLQILSEGGLGFRTNSLISEERPKKIQTTAVRTASNAWISLVIHIENIIIERNGCKAKGTADAFMYSMYSIDIKHLIKIISNEWHKSYDT